MEEAEEEEPEPVEASPVVDPAELERACRDCPGVLGLAICCCGCCCCEEQDDADADADWDVDAEEDEEAESVPEF